MLKGEKVIRKIHFKGFGNKNGKDSIWLSNKRVVLKTVAKGRAVRKTEKHIDVEKLAGVTVSNEKHFNLKVYAISMVLPLLGVGYAYWIDTYFIFSLGAFLGLLILGALLFRKSYYYVGFLLNAVVDSSLHEGAVVELTGRMYKDKQNEIDSMIEEVFALITKGEVIKKVTPQKIVEKVEKEVTEE